MGFPTRPSGSASEVVTNDLLEEAHHLYDQNYLHYHNWRHIEFCLNELRNFGIRAGYFVPVDARLAVVFHDIVYVSGREDNEEKSAGVAASILGRRRFSLATIKRVSNLVRATSRHFRIADDDLWAKIVCDVDYAILGQPLGVYQVHASAIHAEYSRVPVSQYNRERRKFLIELRARPRIFLTDYFARAYEIQAQENIGRELDSL